MAAIRLCALMLLPALVVSAATAHGQSRQNRPLAANPSVFVAADIGFSRLALDRGAAAAVKQYGEADAQILSPQDAHGSVLAKDWAKKAQGAFRLQPQMVMVSCDGNVAVTKGQWAGADQRGPYISVWTRDNKGRLKWRVHQRSFGQAADTIVASDDDEDEFIRTRQAVCSPKAARVAGAGFGEDGSLKWTVQTAMNGGSALHVQIWNGEEMETVVSPAMELAL